MSQEDQLYDVIVCGAGPVGLFFAYQMLMRGHSVYILDSKPCPTTQSRAFFITSRSLEMFENHGIAKHILKKAYILRGAQLIIEGSEMNSVEPDEMGETVFPQLTCVPQSDTERVLASLIEKSNTIHWNTKLVTYTTHHDKITAIITKDNGKTTQRIQGKYLIGADGSHSSVRCQDTTWKYEGYSSDIQFALADVVLSGSDLDMVKDKYNIFYHTKGMFLLIPINYNRYNKDKNLFRIIANTGICEKTVKTDNIVTHGIPENDPYDLTMDEINSILKTRGDSLDLSASDPQWRTHFYINERKANGFRRGRVFLLGDAAHCHSPVGGQGMNLGLQDADNLAWKLSLVLKDSSSDPELLLDSYTKEREPIADQVIRKSSSAAEQTMGVDFVAAIFRYFVFSLHSSDSKTKENGMSNMLQVHLAIDSASPLLLKSDPYLIKSGTFLPETSLLLKRSLDIDSSNTMLDRKSLHQITHNTGKHIALLVATRPKTYEPCSLVSTFWRKFRNSNIRPLVIESVWHVPEYNLAKDIRDEIDDEKQESENFWIEYSPLHAPDSVTKLVGLDNIFSNLSGVEPPAALIIIRPDLYISCSMLVQDELDINKAISFLHTYLK